MKSLLSFRYAFTGIFSCFKAERNFIIHICFTAIAIFLAAFFNISLLEWVALLFCVALVLVAEMINTAIERICNFVHPGIHPEIKIIKDIAAGAVLIAACIAFISGGIIFLPKFFHLIRPL